MRNLERELKKEMIGLIKTDGIQDYRFEKGVKHKRIAFLYDGEWHSVTYSGTPRTEFQNNFVRQSIRRIIRGKDR